MLEKKKKKQTEKKKGHFTQCNVLSFCRSVTDNTGRLREKRNYVGSHCLKVTNSFKQISSVLVVCFEVFVLKAGTKFTVPSALYGFVKTVRL